MGVTINQAMRLIDNNEKNESLKPYLLKLENSVHERISYRYRTFITALASLGVDWVYVNHPIKGYIEISNTSAFSLFLVSATGFNLLMTFNACRKINETYSKIITKKNKPGSIESTRLI